MRIKSILSFSILLLLMQASQSGLFAQTTTIPQGSFIVNMGITPQTVGNALKPYGMVYELVEDYGVNVVWSIEPTKGKDGIDFSHNGIDYRGGTFIIPAEFRTTAVNNRIAFWQSQGVVGANSVSEITVPVFDFISLKTIPQWTMDKKNGSIAEQYFINAGIPPSAYGGSSSNWKDPAELDCCDDLFVMPHADPVWSTHQRLFTWNAPKSEPDGCAGSIWAACHAPSALENMVNPSNRSVQTNFLTVKDPDFTGTSGVWAQSNSLILWGSHSNGSPPYTFNPDFAADPVAQYMGIMDAAMQNGSEQIFIPRQGTTSNPSFFTDPAISRWNPGARIIVYDETQANVTNPNLTTLQNVAAAVVYGRAFDDPDRGYVMYQGGHRHSPKKGGNTAAQIAAQRAFLNFGFYASNRNLFSILEMTGLPASISSGNSVNISAEVDPPGSYQITWTSSCGGTFDPNNFSDAGSSFPTTFTAPDVTEPTSCVITVTIIDECGRQLNESQSTIIQSCQLTFDNTLSNVLCNGQSTGSIDMDISGSTGPFNWNWSRVSPAGTDIGTGTTISGLSAGTYNVTVTTADGCEGTFTATITQPSALSAVATPVDYLCFGQTGAVNLSVNGGIAPYTYSWTGPGGPYATQNLSGITAGTYEVTVTDDNGCTTETSAVVSGPLDAVLVGLDSKSDVSCNGANNGTIDITVSGGTPGYTYLWSDGSTDQNRTGLSPGSYTVTVTDANGCTGTLTETITQPPVLVVSVVLMHPTCPPTPPVVPADPSVNDNGSITVTVNGGTAPYTVSWTGPSSSSLPLPEIPASGGNYEIEDLVAGTYTITVTDDNGCFSTITTTLVEETPNPAQPGTIQN